MRDKHCPQVMNQGEHSASNRIEVMSRTAAQLIRRHRRQGTKHQICYTQTLAFYSDDDRCMPIDGYEYLKGQTGELAAQAEGQQRSQQHGQCLIAAILGGPIAAVRAVPGEIRTVNRIRFTNHVAPFHLSEMTPQSGHLHSKQLPTLAPNYFQVASIFSWNMQMSGSSKRGPWLTWMWAFMLFKSRRSMSKLGAWMAWIRVVALIVMTRSPDPPADNNNTLNGRVHWTDLPASGPFRSPWQHKQTRQVATFWLSRTKWANLQLMAKWRAPTRYMSWPCLCVSDTPLAVHLINGPSASACHHPPAKRFLSTLALFKPTARIHLTIH